MRRITFWILLGLLIGCGQEPEIVVEVLPTSTTTAVSPTSLPTPQPETATSAADANVTYVKAAQTDSNTWTFTVTVNHPDNGWEDYADGWNVVLPDGTVIKPDPNSPFTRLLLHPHDNEQPFTRNQSRIIIPSAITQVTVRAHDLVDGFGGQEVVVDLTAVSGENFEVEKQSN